MPPNIGVCCEKLIFVRIFDVVATPRGDFADDFEVVCEVAVKCWRLNNRMKQRFFKIGNEMTEYERVLGFIRQHGE